MIFKIHLNYSGGKCIIVWSLDDVNFFSKEIHIVNNDERVMNAQAIYQFINSDDLSEVVNNKRFYVTADLFKLIVKIQNKNKTLYSLCGNLCEKVNNIMEAKNIIFESGNFNTNPDIIQKIEECIRNVYISMGMIPDYNLNDGENTRIKRFKGSGTDSMEVD